MLPTEQWLLEYPSRRAYAHTIHSAERCASPPAVDGTRIRAQFPPPITDEGSAGYVLCLPHGRVIGTGHIVAQDDTLLTDYSYRTTDAKVGKRTFRPMRKLHGTVGVLSCEDGQGYWHWLFDVLPRLGLMRRAGWHPQDIDYYLVNSTAASFQEETLRHYGVSLDQVLVSYWHPHVEADVLVAPSLPRSPEVLPSWVCQQLRSDFLPSSSKRPWRKIFVSRRRATHGRVVENDRLYSLLDRCDIDIVALEDMPFIAKVQLLNEARLVVGPLGGGMGNVVFCQPGTKVVELMPPSRSVDDNWRVCDNVGLEYWNISAPELEARRSDLEWIDELEEVVTLA